MGNQVNKPVIVIRDGALKATMWENDSDNGSYLTITFAKTYTNGENKPQDTQSFSRSDLLPLAELARRAYEKGRLYYSKEPTAE